MKLKDHKPLPDWEKLEKRIMTIKQEWEHFITTGKIESVNLIPAKVLSSWVRCRNIGLDPYKKYSTLREEDVAAQIQKNLKLIDIVSPFLQAMADSIEGTGFKVDLYDAELYLIKQYGDANVLENSRNRNAVLGICASELEIGTNAICLSVLLDKPIQLVGPEHYNVDLHQLTCSAVPIKDENGKLVAVINTSGSCWLMHKHTLGMMIALGKSIEYSLRQNNIRLDLEITNRLNEEIIKAISDALVMVDTSGKVVTANKTALKLLGPGQENIIGFQSDAIWGLNNPFLEVLNNREPIVDEEVMFDINGKTVRLIGTVRPIVSGEKQHQGFMGIFKEMNTARGMIKHFVGWKAHYNFADLIGKSAVMRQAIIMAKETAKLQSNTLIQGESGTGKELFAQAIHNESPNHEGPFVVVNCAAIPQGLLESELFGYEGGAFTGSKKGGQPGKFELAEGGTIFLDEINSMPMDMQPKILRVLQNKTVVRVGGNEEIPVKVRVIAATNINLWEKVRRGEFREDLFYRINVISIVIPSLRDRIEDLELLIEHIGERLKKQTNINLTIEQGAIDLMKRYNWPGNVRELENILERSFILARTKGSNVVTADDVLNYPGIRDYLGQNEVKNPADNYIINIEEYSLESLEQIVIQKVLQKNNNNIAHTADSLGISRNTLYRKIKLYGL